MFCCSKTHEMHWMTLVIIKIMRQIQTHRRMLWCAVVLPLSSRWNIAMVTKQRGDVMAVYGWAEQRRRPQLLFGSWMPNKKNKGTVLVLCCIFLKAWTALLRCTYSVIHPVFDFKCCIGGACISHISVSETSLFNKDQISFPSSISPLGLYPLADISAWLQWC